MHAAAPAAGYLHVATHGWFASETFLSQLEPGSSDAGQLLARAERTVFGFAPETLCGLALSCANRGRDATGRVPGILTAEELAILDLRGWSWQSCPPATPTSASVAPARGSVPYKTPSMQPARARPSPRCGGSTTTRRGC